MRVLMPLLVFTQIRSLLFPVALSRAQEPLKVVLFSSTEVSQSTATKLLIPLPWPHPSALMIRSQGGSEREREEVYKLLERGPSVRAGDSSHHMIPRYGRIALLSVEMKEK